MGFFFSQVLLEVLRPGEGIEMFEEAAPGDLEMRFAVAKAATHDSMVDWLERSAPSPTFVSALDSLSIFSSKHRM